MRWLLLLLLGGCKTFGLGIENDAAHDMEQRVVCIHCKGCDNPNCEGIGVLQKSKIRSERYSPKYGPS